MLPVDWTPLMTSFRAKYGKHISEEKLPSHSYDESFSEKIAIGALKAEPLGKIVSLLEEELQEKNKPETSKRYNVSLDSKLTIATKKELVSSEPVDEKTLREKYYVMTNMWLLAQMRQPGRSICKDLDRNTFMDFLETLLDRRNFNLHKEVNGSALLVTEVVRLHVVRI